MCVSTQLLGIHLLLGGRAQGWGLSQQHTCWQAAFPAEHGTALLLSFCFALFICLFFIFCETLSRKKKNRLNLSDDYVCAHALSGFYS